MARQWAAGHALQPRAILGWALMTALCSTRKLILGINLMWKSLPLILNLVGPARAKRLVVGAERLYADQLLEWGILDELVEAEELSRCGEENGGLLREQTTHRGTNDQAVYQPTR